MTEARGPVWRQLSPTLRALGLWITIVQLVGYTTALLFVHHTTGMTPPGVAEQYRGSDSTAVTDAAMKFPKSYPEMLNITHTHLLSMAAIFVVSGVALALCEWPSERWRRFLVVEPFVALLVSFSAMWLMRYVDARFSTLLALSSGLMAVTFYAQSLLVVRELLATRSAR
ncbi:MAG TPA: hypothetical protein VMY76_02950 [Gemmatimonadales bacterium]|nr:hypothetical protein [Gemmatimonadales bacterium]